MITLNKVTKTVKSNKKKISLNLEIDESFEQSIKIPIIERPNIEIIDSEVSKDKISSEETKDTHTYSDKQQNSIEYKYDELINLPDSCNQYIDLNIFYSFGVGDKNCIIESVLYIIDKNYKLLKDVDKINTISTLINLLKENLEKYYKENQYSKKGVKKIDLFNQLHNNTFNEQLLTYLSDYFNINIIILDVIRQNYKLKNIYDSKRKNVVLINHENIHLPLVHIYGELVSYDMINSIMNNFKLIDSKYFTEQNSENMQDAEPEPEPDAEINTKNDEIIDTTSSIYNSNNLKNIRTYSLKELQDLSTQYKVNLNVTLDSGKTKKKTKLQLYNELTEAMN